MTRKVVAVLLLLLTGLTLATGEEAWRECHFSPVYNEVLSVEHGLAVGEFVVFQKTLGIVQAGRPYAVVELSGPNAFRIGHSARSKPLRLREGGANAWRRR